MSWHGRRPPGRVAVGMVVIGAVVVAAGACTHEVRGTSVGKAPSAAPPSPRGAPQQGGVGLSPAGITTRVDVPANATEEEYYQACHAAKEWMEAQPKTGQPLFEPYLAMVQSSASGTPGSWNARWSELTPARQSAVIVAARAAANDECG